MKKYVFFTCGVFGIGGGQLYVANKTKYLTQRGFKVYALSTVSGSARYSGINETISAVFEELQFFPDSFSHKKQAIICNKIIEFLSVTDEDEIIIESNSMTNAVWAERIAAKTNAKHILFLVSEKNECDKYIVDFIEFKAARKEISTIDIRTVENIIDGSSLITGNEITVLKACLGDPIEDYKEVKLQVVEKSDFNVCIIGRGEKAYVSYAALSLAKFCAKNPNVSFSIGFVTEFKQKQKEKEIKRAFLGLKNVKIYFLGYMSPIPIEIFKMFDLYIGGAGCASLAYRQNVLTLAMDVFEDKVLGFMGYDTCTTINNCLKNKNIDECFYDALYTKEYLNKEYISAKQQNCSEAYGFHDEFIEKSSKEKKYFLVRNEKIKFKDKIKARYPRLSKFIIKIKNRK